MSAGRRMEDQREPAPHGVAQAVRELRPELDAASERELEARRENSRARRRRRRKATSQAPMGFALLAALTALTLVVAGHGRPTAQPQSAPQPQPEARLDETAKAHPSTADTGYRRSEPTPFFASYRSLRLHLPVPEGSLTALAFHQASNDKALSMETHLPFADMTRAAKEGRNAVYEYTVTSAPQGVAGMLGGQVLRLWRSNRSGPTDRCADVGAEPGTPVYAPVTGTVMLVRPYDLYKKHPDHEIHIRPDGWEDVDCVLIHVEDVLVGPGDRVVGGLTPVAIVRRLSDRVEHQLGSYVRNGGDHVHVQLNRLDVPGRIEIEGRTYDVGMGSPGSAGPTTR